MWNEDAHWDVGRLYSIVDGHLWRMYVQVAGHPCCGDWQCVSITTRPVVAHGVQSSSSKSKA
eukprot:scaffold79061_cov30-Tisochrysis_lutea.AAC.4